MEASHIKNKLNPPLINVEINPGVTHGSEIVGFNDTGIILSKNIATPPETKEVNTIGIKYSGFNIIGKPKIIGSLMLNKLAGIINFLIDLYFSDFANNVAIHNPNVFPLPPTYTAVATTENVRYGNVFPARKASVLAVPAAINTGI